MKKLLIIVLAVFILSFAAGCTDTAMKADVDALKARVDKLEQDEMNQKVQIEDLAKQIMPASEEKVVEKKEETKPVETPKKPAPPKTK